MSCAAGTWFQRESIGGGVFCLLAGASFGFLLSGHPFVAGAWSLTVLGFFILWCVLHLRGSMHAHGHCRCLNRHPDVGPGGQPRGVSEEP